MHTDPIADMLTRIRNAVRVERPHIDLPLSKVKRGVAEVLKREGDIWDWEEVPSEPLKSFDTKEGFDQHCAWERDLQKAGWAMVPWPVMTSGSS